MQHHENLAMRMQIFADIKAVKTDVVYNDDALRDLSLAFALKSISDLKTLDPHRHDHLIQEGLSRLSDKYKYVA